MKIEQITERVSELNQFNSIGIDFDETLVGHPKSKILWDFITLHPDKKYYIITFRFGASLHYIWDDLEEATGGQLTKKDFMSVIGADPQMSEDFSRYTEIMNIANPQKRERVISARNFDMKFLQQRAQEYKESKAKACRSLGCGLLIDDRRGWVIDGCKKYGIRYMHPDNL